MTTARHETVHFSGRVQGVGFRYTALQVAKEFEVSGYVCNLPDGRVKLGVEGEGAEIDRFVAAIEERMHGYVRKTERACEPAAAGYVGFTIR